MEYKILGRTGLKVSALGIGCGGYSKLGASQGKSDDNALAVLRRALELGINVIDTAEAYGNENLVGRAIRGVPRASLVLCTKTDAGSAGQPRDPRELSSSVEQSLRNFGTDYIDIYQLHGVPADVYPHVVNQLVPELLRLRDQGKIRFIGVTEGFESDPSHEMHKLSSHDDCWDTLMVGLNFLNTSARRTVFPYSRPGGVGILNMFAVRYALVNQENLKPTLERLVRQGLVPSDEIDFDRPLEFLLDEAESLPEAGYRYCLQDPDIHVVLFGTGSIAHLEENVRAAEKGPLSRAAVERLDRIFGKVDAESGKRP